MTSPRVKKYARTMSIYPKQFTKTIISNKLKRLLLFFYLSLQCYDYISCAESIRIIDNQILVQIDLYKWMMMMMSQRRSKKEQNDRQQDKQIRQNNQSLKLCQVVISLLLLIYIDLNLIIYRQLESYILIFRFTYLIIC